MTSRHAFSRARLQAARRLGWGVADQAVSSLENFTLGVFVARSMGAASLGALGVALVAYTTVLNISRALATDPLMVRFSEAPRDSWRRAVASASAVALLTGAACGLVCLALGVALRTHLAEAGGAFIALGVVLPGLTLQDSWRFAFFAAGEGAKAFVNDLVWTVLLVGALVVGELTDVTGVGWSLLAFGGSAALAGGLGMAQARVVPDLAAVRSWLREHHDLGTRFLVENVALGTAGRIRSFVVAGTVGLAGAGAIRGAEMLTGPIGALLMGVAQVAVPEAARALKRGSGRLVRLCLGLSAGLAVGALAWGLVVVVVFPLGLGEMLLGTVWPNASVLVLGATVTTMGGCLQIGPSAGLRALGRADKTMRSQLAVSVTVLTFGCGGAVLWQAQGAVWGAAAASVVGAGIWWRQLFVARREHVAAQRTPAVLPRTVQTPVPERG